MSERTPNIKRRNNNINEFQTPPIQMSLSNELKKVLNERNLLTVKSRAKVCNMLDENSSPTIINNEFDKRNLLRRKAIEEILTSEKTYIKQLDILMKYFVKPLKDIVDTSTHTSLFGQIEMIYNLNSELLSELDANLDNVSKAFLKMAPFFKLYSVYAFDYKQALLILQDLYNKNQTFRKFLYNTETRPEVQTKLNSLLICPIQRIPRYRLLLQQILLYTSPADFDYKILQDSVKEIESTVSHINSVIEDQENTQVLLNLQNSLVNRTPNIVKPSRKIIKEGVLMKISSSGTTLKRYCILMSDLFMYCKILKEHPKNTLIENSLQCSCIFPLKKCKIMEIFPGNFKISCQGDGIILSTNDIRDGQTWVCCLKEAIELHIQCRQTLRKESSKRKPIRKKDLKNFENDFVLSPNKRKVEYDAVFRCGSSSDSEPETSKAKTCFNLRPSQGILKRRNRSPINTNKLSKIQKIDETNDENIAENDQIMKTSNDNNDFDSTYGFSKLSDSTTFYRAENIDVTLKSIELKDTLYPLRENTGSNRSSISDSTSSILKKTNDETESIHSSSSNDSENRLKKRVQFDFGKTNVLFTQSNNLTFDDYQTGGYRFPNLRQGDYQSPTIKQRIARFFSSLF